MGEAIHPDDASLDALIEWLRCQRADQPTASLSSLLAGRRIDARQLVDIACIDLMERRRLGHPVRVEDYSEPFSQLQSDERLLDLIDAEICVAGELGQSIELAEYQRRFPDLAKQIAELLGLESLQASKIHPMPPPDESRSRGLGSTHADEILDPSASFSVELAIDGDRDPTDALPEAAGHPLRAPEWFAAEKCFASGPGRWLIRGRDSIRGVVMAMKVIQLPPQLDPAQSRLILDACEAASKVRNPMWVAPTIAAIQRHHLGVIRPWVFAVSWSSAATARDVATQLGDLASIAFCLEAAHQAGAAHGAVHAENILLDHDGKLRMVDAVANRDGMYRWFDNVDSSRSEPSILSLRHRKRIDLEDMIRLIAQLSASWRRPWTGRLLGEVGKIADGDADGALGALGALLMRYADQSRRS